jgi:hypothetical protein
MRAAISWQAASVRSTPAIAGAMASNLFFRDLKIDMASSFALVQSEEIDTRNVIVHFVQISAMRVLTASVTPCCVECVWWAIFQLKILRWRRRQIHLPR